MPQPIEPMPVPFTLAMRDLDVPQEGGLIPKKMLALEFHSFNGVAVYFVDEEMAKQIVNGLGQKIKKMQGKFLHVAKDIPNG